MDGRATARNEVPGAGPPVLGADPCAVDWSCYEQRDGADSERHACTKEEHAARVRTKLDVPHASMLKWASCEGGFFAGMRLAEAARAQGMPDKETTKRAARATYAIDGGSSCSAPYVHKGQGCACDDLARVLCKLPSSQGQTAAGDCRLVVDDVRKRVTVTRTTEPSADDARNDAAPTR